jgi:hypothetical protein
MVEVIYEVVEHNGGWAYKAFGVYSETFRTPEQARRAAAQAAARQQLGGRMSGIVFQDPGGNWRKEVSDGSKRPVTRFQG